MSISFTANENYKSSGVTFPAAFLSPPITVSGTYGPIANGSASDAYVTTATGCTIIVNPVRGTTFGNGTTNNYEYIAIGKWK